MRLSYQLTNIKYNRIYVVKVKGKLNKKAIIEIIRTVDT